MLNQQRNQSLSQKLKSMAIGYLDGSLPEEQKIEFERELLKNSELKIYLENRRREIDKILKFFPVINVSKDIKDDLNRELNQSLNELVKPYPNTWWGRVIDKLEVYLRSR